MGPSIRKAAAAGIRTVMITGGTFYIRRLSTDPWHALHFSFAYRLVYLFITDYVKTAKAIAVNIGLLPPSAPSSKAVDCEVIRVRVAVGVSSSLSCD